jgi:hypothetical protein
MDVYVLQQDTPLPLCGVEPNKRRRGPSVRFRNPHADEPDLSTAAFPKSDGARNHHALGDSPWMSSLLSMSPEAIEDAGWGQRMVGDVLGDVSGDVSRTAYQTRDVVRVDWKRDPRSRTEIKCFSICISPCNSEFVSLVCLPPAGSRTLRRRMVRLGVTDVQVFCHPHLHQWAYMMFHSMRNVTNDSAASTSAYSKHRVT